MAHAIARCFCSGGRARFVARRSALDVPDLVVDAEGFAVTIRRDVGGEAVRRRGSIFTELTRLVATVDSAQLAAASVSP
jgi:hypothetical protein